MYITLYIFRNQILGWTTTRFPGLLYVYVNFCTFCHCLKIKEGGILPFWIRSPCLFQISYLQAFFYSFHFLIVLEFLFFLFKFQTNSVLFIYYFLKFFVRVQLTMLREFQAHSIMSQHLYALHCAHHKGSYCLSPYDAIKILLTVFLCYTFNPHD